MWWWRKNDEEPKLAGRAESDREEAYAEIKAFRDVGETFNYLGRTCVVTGHLTFLPVIGSTPCLIYEYCDDHGVIRERRAFRSEIPALVKQQEAA